MTYDPSQTASALRELAEKLLAEADQREKQLTRADLAGMTPQAITDAHDRGQLDQLLRGDAG